MLIDRYMQSLRENAEIYEEKGATVDPGAFEALQAKGHDVSIDAIKRKLKPGQKKALKGAALGAAGVGAAALGIKALKKHRAKKAKEVAVEEGVSLEEAFDYVLECEQALLDEGYDYDDIYEEEMRFEYPAGYGPDAGAAVKKGLKEKLSGAGKAVSGAAGTAGKHIMANKGKYAAGAAGAAALGAGAALALKKHRANKAKQVAVEEGVSLEEAFDYVLECEQLLLDEGYDFSDIYED